jgi:murein L,D-transpeptidase YcbB/YkuD
VRVGFWFSWLALVACEAGALAAPKGGVSEPGLDMIMIDAEAMPAEPELANDQPQAEDISWTGAPVDLLKPIHHIYTDLRRQQIRYQRDWGSLPQVRVPERGSPLVLGADNARLQALRERLGLTPAGGFDAALAERVAAFQRVHGLPVDGKPGALTLAALNRGALHYERKLLMNMERARRLPAPGTAKRYILVDAGSARLWMYENGQVVDSMKVIVGAPSSATPMMAALMRFASINPYWNVPVDLVATLIAPRVVSGGTSYLVDRRYEVLDSWEADAKVVDPATVDWSAVAAGKTEARVRQLPGGANSMGAMKFMMPNEYGIYLHDTLNKALFAGEDRWVSNGCVRLEDAGRLARWIFGGMPRPTQPDREDHLQLYEPMPVYITYFTAAPEGSAAIFRPDPYERDAKVLARFTDKEPGMRDTRPPLMIDLDALPKSGEDGKAKQPSPSKRQNGGKPTSKSPVTRKTSQPRAIAVGQGRGFRVVLPSYLERQRNHSGANGRS